MMWTTGENVEIQLKITNFAGGGEYFSFKFSILEYSLKSIVFIQLFFLQNYDILKIETKKNKTCLFIILRWQFFFLWSYN